MLNYRVFGLGHMGLANSFGMVTLGSSPSCAGSSCGRSCGRRTAGTPRETDPAPGVLTVLALVADPFWTLFPIFWITTASFKTERSLYARRPSGSSSRPILENYRWVLGNIPFIEYLTNSLVIAIGTTVGSLVLGSAGGLRIRPLPVPRIGRGALHGAGHPHGAPHRPGGAVLSS